MTHPADHPDHGHDMGSPSHIDPAVHHTHDLHTTPSHLGPEMFDIGHPIADHGGVGHSALGTDHHLATLYGHPEQSKQDWFYQNSPNQCGPSAVTQVLEHLTGHHVADQSEVLKYAESKGYLTDGGMPASQVSESLAHFGVPNHIVQGQGIVDLEHYLSTGHEVLVSVDAPTIWYHQDSPGHPADHVVQLTGIDTTTNTVYLSDTGNPDLATTHTEAVPLDVFEHAWATANSDVNAATNPTGDGNHLAIVTDAGYHGTQPTLPGDPLHVAAAHGTSGSPVEGAAIILPMAFAGAGLWGLSRWGSA